MPVVIPDDVLTAAHLTEQEAKTEIACRLFEIGRLSLTKASRFAGVPRIQFEEELHQRKIPAYRYTKEMLHQDLQTLEWLRNRDDAAGR
jgi:predicted HTH domain antitoxin